MQKLSLSKLYEPVRQYITEIRQDNLFSFAPSVTVTENDTLGTVISKLAATRLHRVYVKDRNERPSGVIALEDLIRIIVNAETFL